MVNTVEEWLLRKQEEVSAHVPVPLLVKDIDVLIDKYKVGTPIKIPTTTIFYKKHKRF